MFPRTDGAALTAVLLNTAGGITGGDRFDQRATAQPGTQLTLSTQAAERAYRAASGRGRVCTGLTVQQGARIDWLPQETILYDGSALARRLDVTLVPGARALLVESLIFGRTAMGETVRQLDLDDRITVTRAGRIVFADRTRMMGDAQARLAGRATGQGARALASLIFAAPEAGDLLEAARALLPPTGGISQPAPDLLFARLLAPDGFALRRALIPLIGLFRQAPLPKVWMI
ncbi:urease accessory protein UreD [Aestuariivita sp.]|uniref:urease accessory protein UreD n=1 Tax=Aestuariivita sp. TaxID=1872407 RepID=UPI0025C6AF37|nr:urease accessory protein UreD [Aestuariivita sp.]